MLGEVVVRLCGFVVQDETAVGGGLDNYRVDTVRVRDGLYVAEERVFACSDNLFWVGHEPTLRMITCIHCGEYIEFCDDRAQWFSVRPYILEEDP